MKEQNTSQKIIKLTVLKKEGFNVKNFVEITTQEVEAIIAQQEVPQYILDRITNQLMVEPKGLAVRSAAIGEDGQQLAWPGQFKTRLNVHYNELAEAILECANAKASSAVKAYAKSHKVDIPQLALFVQEMVAAEKAGVIFTTNPVSSSEEIVIEVISGTADALVSGCKEPTRYYIDANEKTLVKREGDMGYSLSINEIQNLVEIGQSIKALFKQDQDIEWAIEKNTGEIFINQSRDITGLQKVDVVNIRTRAIKEADDYLAQELSRLQQLGAPFQKDILSDQNIAEILTQHPCQMSFGLFTYEFAHGNGAIRTARNEIGYQIGQELEKGFFHLVGGQPRCSIVHDALTYRIRGISLSDYCRIVDFYLSRIERDVALANYPELVLYEQNPSLQFLTDIFNREKAAIYQQAYKRFFAKIRALEQSLDKVCLNNFLPFWHKKIEGYKSQGMPKDLESLSIFFHKICNDLREQACPIFVKVARLGFFSYARLGNLLKSLFDGDGEEYRDVLTGGIPLSRNPNLSFSIKLAEMKEGKISLKELVQEFGHLAPYGMEISAPRYWETPELLDNLAAQIPGDIKKSFQHSLSQAKHLKQRLLNKAGKRSQDLKREIEVARTYLPLRETVKFAFLRGYALLREIAINIEQALDWEPGLIFHLDPREVFTIYSRQDELYELAQLRQRQLEENRMLYIPAVIDSQDLECIGSIPNDTTDQFFGIGVTKFIAEGEAVVLPDLKDREAVSQLALGKILVTKTADPGLAPMLALIGNKGGLVTEIGGQLSHGAIYAREVGMAAVLNVPHATDIIKTGMRLRVNSPQGQGSVEIINK